MDSQGQRPLGRVRFLFATLLVAAVGIGASAPSAIAVPGNFWGVSPQATPSLEQLQRLKAGGEYIKVEQPGYAAPCWHDVDGDGKKDLLVGQFKDGKIKVYRNEGGGKFAAGEWLKAEGDVAKVPGVW